MKLILRVVLIFSALAGLFAMEAARGEEPAKTVKEILVENNRVVSANTILSQVKSRPGIGYSRELLNEDIKRLYSLGYFSDVSVDLRESEEGVTVVFIVTEKPVIDKLLFQGNRILREKKLREVVKSKAGEPLNSRQLKEDTEEIYKLYKKKGYHLARVEEKTEVDESTLKAVVTILIDEGMRYKIHRVVFNGNQSFSPSKLIKLMKTRPGAFFRGGLFDRAVFDTDLEALRTFYKNSGFLDAEVSDELKYDEKRGHMDVVVNITEGKKYFVGTVNISGNVIFPESELRSKIALLPDEVFSQDKLVKDISNLQSYYFEKGYVFARVDSRTALDPETGKINVIHAIVENELAYLDKIKIRGNIKTKDAVIRREMRVSPGEPFDGVKLRRSKERLNNLGYFEEVYFDTEPGSGPQKQDLIVNVKETKTGEFSFGAGYSTVQEFIGFVDVRQKNFDITNPPTFTGGGQRLRLRTEIGTVSSNSELSFTEPWIFNRPVSFGLDVYKRTISESEDYGYGYDEERTGFDLRLGKEMGEYNRGDITYRFEEVDISSIPDDASADFKAEEGVNQISSLALKVSRDTRDNVFLPNHGYVASESVELAGGPLSGDKDFVKYFHDSSFFKSFFEKFLLELRMRAGLADEYDDSDTVPIFDRFYAGGANTVRGYRERRIGPRDPVTEDPIGGEALLVGNAEVSFPVVQNLRGAIFYDVGNVWQEIDDFASGGYKSSVGAGVRVKTPLGPIRLDYGFPLSRIEGEKESGRFHFSMSSMF